MNKQKSHHMEALKCWDSLSSGLTYMVRCLPKCLQETVSALDSWSQASNLLGSDLLLKVMEMCILP